MDTRLVPRTGSGRRPRSVPYGRVSPVRCVLVGRRVEKEEEKEGPKLSQIGACCKRASKITLTLRLTQVFRGVMQMQCGGVHMSRGDRQDCGGTTRLAAALRPGLGGGRRSKGTRIRRAGVGVGFRGPRRPPL